MKFKLFLGCLIFLLSCGKKIEKIGTDYYKLIGEWKNINGDENILIMFSKRGKVSVEREFARGGHFYIDKLVYLDSLPNNSQFPQTFMLKTKKYEQFGYSDALYLYTNDLEQIDSISVSGFWLIENSTYKYDEVIFIRQ